MQFSCFAGAVNGDGQMNQDSSQEKDRMSSILI